MHNDPKHGHLIIEYAKDVSVLVRPFEMWQSRKDADGYVWKDFTERDPQWRSDHEYRRKLPSGQFYTHLERRPLTVSQFCDIKLIDQGGVSGPVPPLFGALTGEFSPAAYEAAAARLAAPRTAYIHPPRMGTEYLRDGTKAHWFGTREDLDALNRGKAYAL